MGQTLLAQVSGIRHPKQANHPRRMETNATPPSARRMWHDRAAHACDFAQRYAEPLDYAVFQRMIELSRQRRGLDCGGGSGREAVALSDRGSTAAGFQARLHCTWVSH